MQEVDTLVKYGQSYQSKVVASLITDIKFLEQVSEITKPAFFESQANQWIISEVQKYFDEYRAVPTMEVFKIKVGEIEDKGLKQTVVEQLKNVYLQVGAEDIPYVKKEYLTFAKNQKVKEALFKSVDLLKIGQYDQIIDTMMKASKVGVESDLGLDYIENFESILDKNQLLPIPDGAITTPNSPGPKPPSISSSITDQPVGHESRLTFSNILSKS